jgi:hypothetical protein
MLRFAVSCLAVCACVTNPAEQGSGLGSGSGSGSGSTCMIRDPESGYCYDVTRDRSLAVTWTFLHADGSSPGPTCADIGVNTVSVYLYAENPTVAAETRQLPCAAGQGTLTGLANTEYIVQVQLARSGVTINSQNGLVSLGSADGAFAATLVPDGGRVYFVADYVGASTGRQLGPSDFGGANIKLVSSLGGVDRGSELFDVYDGFVGIQSSPKPAGAWGESFFAVDVNGNVVATGKTNPLHVTIGQRR